MDKGRVFFENLSPKTTTESLQAYLSKEYQIKSCETYTRSGKFNEILIINRIQ